MRGDTIEGEAEEVGVLRRLVDEDTTLRPGAIVGCLLAPDEADVPAELRAPVVPARVTTLSLTFDHRLVDGAPAARFLGRVCELLGRPYLLL